MLTAGTRTSFPLILPLIQYIDGMSMGPVGIYESIVCPEERDMSKKQPQHKEKRSGKELSQG